MERQIARRCCRVRSFGWAVNLGRVTFSLTAKRTRLLFGLSWPRMKRSRADE
jgi:hypothetical protein